ncbi:hypothetical protein KEH57_04130 [Burkholderia cenocepacia]|uniref:hypothetical protein n=1 Tax=Burkholderia cenocepacia TaxID=95486 RepID=UPI001BA88AD1|nr:hypothetical protein [Burkholderia cenocepacia]QUO26129.1 hypothetical protein KEH57_04130 [Burkholderia cenocepacia]
MSDFEQPLPRMAGNVLPVSMSELVRRTFGNARTVIVGGHVERTSSLVAGVERVLRVAMETRG